MELTNGQKRYRKYRALYLEYAKKERSTDNGYTNKLLFGGNRLKVLDRDGYKCVRCGMDNEEHIKRWNRSLTVDHIDGNGCNSKKKNNSMRNLQTLCLSCHGLKDIFRSENTRPKSVIQISVSGEIIKRFESGMDAERRGNFSSKRISDCVLGKRKTHKGFRWISC